MTLSSRGVDGNVIGCVSLWYGDWTMDADDIIDCYFVCALGGCANSDLANSIWNVFMDKVDEKLRDEEVIDYVFEALRSVAAYFRTSYATVRGTYRTCAADETVNNKVKLTEEYATAFAREALSIMYTKKGVDFDVRVLCYDSTTSRASDTVR